MKIKWKCLLRAIGYPVICAIIFCLITITIISILAPPPTPLDTTTSYNGAATMPTGAPIIFIIPIILMILLAISRELVKPCLIKENTITDEIVNGVSTIFDLIQFFTSALLFIFSVMIIIWGMQSFIDPIHTSYTDSPVGLFIVAFIMIVISYFIYPKDQINNTKLGDDHGKI